MDARNMPDPAKAGDAKAKKQTARRKRAAAEVASSNEESDGGLEFPEDDDDDEGGFDEMIVTEPVVGASSSRAWAPPSFMTRDAYKALSNEGLAALPPVTGVGLRYHRSTCQWHATFGGRNVEPKWGEIRSERAALLIALSAVWRWFCELNPSDEDAAEHLRLLESKLAS